MRTLRDVRLLDLSLRLDAHQLKAGDLIVLGGPLLDDWRLKLFRAQGSIGLDSLAVVIQKLPGVFLEILVALFGSDYMAVIVHLEIVCPRKCQLVASVAFETLSRTILDLGPDIFIVGIRIQQRGCVDTGILVVQGTALDL